MAMATFEIEDKFMRDIDALIKRTGKYKTRSEFFKDSARSKYKEIDEQEWRKKFRETADEMSRIAYSRGYKGGFPTREERAKIADEYIKKQNIQLI
jgi:Arc/MetJ-type ribon-helix-helix transcriptional regulator